MSMSQQDLERRVAALEAQATQQSGGQAGQSNPQQGAMVQAFLQGMFSAYAAQQVQSQGLVSGAQGGRIQGLFGWSPTQYDSFFWCRSRFMCNPDSLSCLC